MTYKDDLNTGQGEHQEQLVLRVEKGNLKKYR